MASYPLGKTIWMTVDLMSGTMEARRKWCNIFQVLKGKDSESEFYPVKIFFRSVGKPRCSQMEEDSALVDSRLTLKL